MFFIICISPSFVSTIGLCLWRIKLRDYVLCIEQGRTYTACTWTGLAGTGAMLNWRSLHRSYSTRHCRWSTCMPSTLSDVTPGPTCTTNVRSTRNHDALTWPTSSRCCSSPSVTQITGSCAEWRFSATQNRRFRLIVVYLRFFTVSCHNAGTHSSINY